MPATGKIYGVGFVAPGFKRRNKKGATMPRTAGMGARAGSFVEQAPTFEQKRRERLVSEGREFQARSNIEQIQQKAREDRELLLRKQDFGREMLGKLDTPPVSGAAFQGPSESERMLIKAQEEAGEKDINRLQDVLSGAGIFSSGTLAVGTGEILGAARAGVARTSAGFAESRLTRRHQQLLAKRQQLTSIIQSILV